MGSAGETTTKTPNDNTQTYDYHQDHHYKHDGRPRVPLGLDGHVQRQCCVPAPNHHYYHYIGNDKEATTDSKTLRAEASEKQAESSSNSGTTPDNRPTIGYARRQ